MAGAQAKLGMRVLLNGIPSMLEFEDYTSAYPKKVMEGTRGGSFVAGEHWVGIEAMKGALTLKGATPAMLSQYGLTAGALIPVTIFETFRDEDGAVIQAQEIWQMAEITAIEQSNTQMGPLRQHVINFSIKSARRLENGKTVFHVDRNANIVDLGLGNVLAAVV